MSFQRTVKPAPTSILQESIKTHVDQYLSQLNILALFDKLRLLEGEIEAVKHNIVAVQCTPSIEVDNIAQELSDMRTKIEEIDNGMNMLGEIIHTVSSRSPLFQSVIQSSAPSSSKK